MEEPDWEQHIKYRIDRVTREGEVTPYWWNELWGAECDARAHIEKMNPKYRDELLIVEMDVQPHKTHIIGRVRV